MKKYNLDFFKIVIALILGAYIFLTMKFIYLLSFGTIFLVFFMVMLLFSLSLVHMKSDIKYLFFYFLLYLIILEIMFMNFRAGMSGNNSLIFKEADVDWGSAFFSYVVVYLTPLFILINLLILFAKKPKK